MSIRALLKNGICIASALALLVAVISSPIRPGSPAFGSSPDCLRRNFGLAVGHAAGSPVKLARAPSVVKAVRAQNDAKRSGASRLAESRVRVALPPFLPSPAREPSVPRSSAASHPLRC